MSIKLHFHGGARTVTGANYLLETDQAKVLIDCGMFQGINHAEERNYEDFPYDPKEIDAVLITHAHVDHTGRIPKLYRDGFKGTVYATSPTMELTELNLEDSVKIIGREANRDGHPPLYRRKDIKMCMQDVCTGKPYGEKFEPALGITARFRDGGHILGSSIIEVWAEDTQGKKKKIVFSGDLGNPPVPLLRPTEFIEEADYIVIESAYGNREHEDRENREKILKEVVLETMQRKGVLLIPAFAIERTQELIFTLNNFVESGEIPQVPVFLDAPLAIKITKVYRKYTDYFNEKTREQIADGDKIFTFPGLSFTESSEESKEINNVPPPKIIIAGSGMSTGGRILHHERRYLSDANNTILFIGYQVAGTRGRRIFDGDEKVRIFGDMVSIRANVRAIGGYSAHADREGLIFWVSRFQRPVQHVFTVQGEDGPAMDLAQAISDKLSIDASAPMLGDVVDL